MDELVKQRLVGAVVLALIAVVLIPWMFGSPKDPRMTIQPSFAGTPVPNVANQRNEVVLLEPWAVAMVRRLRRSQRVAPGQLRKRQCM